VLTTPALDLLKRHRSDLRVAVVVEHRFREIFEDNPDIDEILPPDLPALRQFRPRLCLNLHGGTRSAWMTALSGAHYRAGFAHYRTPFVYNVRIPKAQEILSVDRKVHTAEHLASAMFYLGVPLSEIPRAKLSGAGLPACPGERSSPAIIHPVAAIPAKTWPAANFLAIAGHLKQNGIEPIFIGGPDDDLSPFHPHRTIAGAPVSQIKSLLASASLFVGNDSGPAHMAAAFGLPAVILFGSSDPDIWGPWRTTGEAVTAPDGIGSIPAAQVIRALERVRVHA
jgi:heptosyltransferase-3